MNQFELGGDNIEMYLPEDYQKIIENLNSAIAQYGLDEVTIAGVVRGSIEVEQQPIHPVSRVWKSKSGETFSVKASNIKVNLNYALKTAFRIKTVFVQKDVWLAAAIIHMIVDLFTDAKKLVDEKTAIILLAVFRLQNGDIERIMQYAQTIIPKESGIELNKTQCQEALDNLESLQCIEIKDGEYIVRESIDSSLYL